MSKSRLYPVIALCTLGLLGVVAGCHAEAQVGTPPKVAPPPPPPVSTTPPVVSTPPPPPPPPVATRPIKAMGKAKIVNNEIQIPGKIHFDINKATLKSDKETTEVLDTVQKVLAENTQITKLHIEGHTDDKGQLADNNKLSQDRADSVAKWLTDHSIDKGRLATAGYGPSRPLVANDTEEHREANRRTEFKLWELDGKATDAQTKDAAGTTSTASPTGTATTAATAPTGTTKVLPSTPPAPTVKKP